MLDRIRASIQESGYHIYVVAGGQAPRFAYTIGLSLCKGAEILVAGAAVYSLEEIKTVIDTLAKDNNLLFGDGATMSVAPHGVFSLHPVHPSWASHFVLGAIDYFNTPEVSVLQVLPDDAHTTIDVPDLSRPWCIEAEPVWQWLTEPWTHSVPKRSTAVTDLDALKGATITEIMRWEDDGWEAFAGPGADISKEQVRVVPLGTLLGADPTLSKMVELRVGEGLRRSSDDLAWKARK